MGRDCALVFRREREDLSNAIAAALNDEALRSRITRNATELVRLRFADAVVGPQLAAIYSEISKRRNVARARGRRVTGCGIRY